MMMNGVCKMVKKVKRVLAVMITLVLVMSILGDSKLIAFAKNNATLEQESTKTPSVAEGETASEKAISGEDKQTESSAVTKDGETDKKEQSPKDVKETLAKDDEKITTATQENKQEKPTVAENNVSSEQEKNQESDGKTTKENETIEEAKQSTTENAIQSITEKERKDTLQNMVNEEQTDSIESSTEQEAKAYEAEAIVDQMRIKVRAEAGVLPSDAILKAKALKEDGDTSAQYSEAKAALDKENSIEYDGFMAYDIGFTDSTGQEIEPTGKVSVSMEMTTPEGAESESLSVQHHEKTASGIWVETVADAKNETSGKVDVQGQETLAEFEVESFSTFTITWSSSGTKYFEVTVHYINTNGDEIDEPTHSDMTIANGETITLSNLAPTVSGLTYQKAYYGSFGGSEITSMEASQSGSSYNRTRKLTFKNGDSEVSSLSYSGGNTSTQKADIYLEYKTDNVTPPSPTPTKSLSKSKTVVRKEDGIYDLNLSISGAVGTVTNKAKLDILLIIDRSGSMEDESRMDNAKTAAKSLIDTVNSKNATIDAQYAVVSFGSNGYYRGTNADGPAGASKTEQNWSSSVGNVKTSIDNIGVGGGTNYQSGISLGKTVLGKARSDAQKVVIFLTDGLPTFRLNGNEQAGNGSNDRGGYNQAAAVEEIKGMGCDQFYAIGVGSDFANEDSTARNNLNELVANVGQSATPKPSKKAVYAASSGDLNKVFDDIAASTTSFLCDHVNVTDTLSENVEIVTDANGAPTNLLIKVTKADGEEITSEGSEVVKDSNGNYVSSITLPATEENKEATIKAIYSNGKIQMEFPQDYKLEANWDYQVTTTIKATEKAYQKYRENGYLDTADAGTGTHASDVGFYSNNNDEAKVTYTYDEENEEELFDKPVIQLNPGTLVIEKEITGLEGEEAVDALNALKASLVFEVSLNDATEPMEYRISQFTYNDQTKKYTCIITGLSPNTSYTITEKGNTVNGYDVTTTISDKDKTDGKDDSVGIVAGGETKTVSFTNAYAPSNRTMTVKKVVDGNMSDSDKEFNFTYKIGNDGEEKSFTLKDDGTYNIENIPSGSTVVVTETDNDGYKTSWEINKEKVSEGENQKSYMCTVTQDMTDESNMLVCVNHKDGNPPTGMTHNQTPFVLMFMAAICFVLCGVGRFLLYRVRR